MRTIAVFAAAALLAAPTSSTEAQELEATEVDAVAEEAPAPEPAPTPAGEVARAVFTSGIADREPIDQLDALANDVEEVVFFTEVRGLAGGELIHRWEYAGEVVAEVPFAIGGDRWRVWSTKQLPTGSLGEWSVTVVDGAGSPLATESFLYAEAAAPDTPISPEEEIVEPEPAPAAAEPLP